jgi:hypothetical protein
MKKARIRGVDELRSEYKRSDFDVLVRGKYIERLRESSNVVVLDPRVAEFFPNAASVNSALLSLAEIAKRSARLPRSRAPAWSTGLTKHKQEIHHDLCSHSAQGIRQAASAK